MKIYKITDKKYFCPECGHDKLVGKSAQVCEDGCEMWLQCAKCGNDPANGINDHVETVWGWDDRFVGYAFEVWKEKIDERIKQKV